MGASSPVLSVMKVSLLAGFTALALLTTTCQTSPGERECQQWSMEKSWMNLCCQNHTTNKTCYDHCQLVIAGFGGKKATAETTGMALNIAKQKPECGLIGGFTQCILDREKHFPPPVSELSLQKCTSKNCTRPEYTSDHWCCNLAKTTTCRQACQSFGKVLARAQSSIAFKECQRSGDEMEMSVCIEQDKSPAMPACDGMLFCKNFSRPGMSFNNCSLSADIEALTQYRRWLDEGKIRFNGVAAGINISRCLTSDVWKALSCFLTLQPTNSFLDRRMCRASCDWLLGSCKKENPGVDERSCEHADGEYFANTTDCLDLEDFIDVPARSIQQSFDTITNPCIPNPCEHQMCVVNRDCQKSGNCRANHTCVPGCALDSSHTYVFDKHWVKMSPTSYTINTSLISTRYCQCNATEHGFNRCVTMVKSPGKQCNTSEGAEDGTHYTNSDGDPCLCDDGHERCLVNLTRLASTLEANDFFTQYALVPSISHADEPCHNCEKDVMVPVCGADGRVYRNKCFAAFNKALPQTAGLDCMDRRDSICRCKQGQNCVPRPGICLSDTAACPQYACESSACTPAPFCDTCGQQHAQACSSSLQDCLSVSDHAPMSCLDCSWSYPGRCLYSCNHTEQSCGMDGQTYHSQCARQALGIPEDYPGPCTHLSWTNAVNVTELDIQCEDVQCPAIPEFCKPLPRLPGTCCDVCGSIVSVVASFSAADTYSSATGKPLIRAHELVLQLQEIRSLSFCDVRGFMLGSMLLAVVTVHNAHTSISQYEVQACQTQAALLNTLINERNPIIVALPPLSILERSTLYTSEISPAVQLNEVQSSSAAADVHCSYRGSWRWWVYAAVCMLSVQLSACLTGGQSYA
ncbi:reversion-inducing cysteine-rich protein with Kazal motifs-like isoform X1 [Sycon ciliatum]|uniref:reversion-inducing cysteine-rich protein with Kazal motifs-like isoform X1 n=1 Tax=Sycon ciliatum TaxID=27933 RepID=UPI0031F7113A